MKQTFRKKVVKTNFSALLLGACSLVGMSCPQLVFAASPETNVQAVQQAKKVSGTVSDATGPVIGASVVVKGTSNGVATDFDGNF